LSWAAGVHTPKDRTKGYKRALKEAKIPIDPDLIISGPKFVPKHTGDLARKLINTRDRPTAIFASNNQLGIGAIQVIREAKLRIPDEIALVVFDDLDVFTLLDPPVTAIAQPASQMGRRAMQLVINCIERPNDCMPETVILPTKLIVRKSV
jgi:DNA-binding LacI/PurR family transcriptional regulator